MSSGSTIAMCLSTSGGANLGQATARMFRQAKRAKPGTEEARHRFSTADQIVRVEVAAAVFSCLRLVRRQGGAMLRLVDRRRNDSKIPAKHAAEMRRTRKAP